MRVKQGAERLRRELEEERGRDGVIDLLDEADKLETVKKGIERNIEEIDLEMAKRRRDLEGLCKRLEGRIGSSGSIY